jgi:protein-tyrosine phosphatase
MKVLFVCLGNICRSPTAEGVLRHLAAREYPALDLFVDSAGTADYHVGAPPDRRTMAAALARGYDLSALRARQVNARDLADFDHVFAMDRTNLVALERLAGPAARTRPMLYMGQEVPDPYYGGPEDFERVLDLCEAASRDFLEQCRSRK